METTLKLEQIDPEGHVLGTTTVDVKDRNLLMNPLPTGRKLFIKDGDDLIGCLRLDIDLDGSIKTIELEKYL